ncbi:MAG: TlyA family RNA methyltransferase [Candidatus Obscuribacterales bacterium]
MANRKEKQRLDVLCVERGLFPSRREAQSAIMTGMVLVNGEKATKAGSLFCTADDITLKSSYSPRRFVSRGGLKLEKALADFAIDLNGRVCLDVGASTGGFTDCMLRNGADTVYAIDVGYGQLDWQLRNDPRVVVKERLNARYLKPEDLYGSDLDSAYRPADFAAVDCSFISLAKIVPVLASVMKADRLQAVCLVKPQFEAGREAVRKGVVRDPGVHRQVLKSVREVCLGCGLVLLKATYSPVKGPAGNIEFLVMLETCGEPMTDAALDEIVDRAFSELS